MLNQYAVDHPTFPVNQRFFQLIQILFLQRWAAKHLGHALVYRETFLQIQPRLLQHFSAGIESMEFRNIRTDSLINGGTE